MTRSAIRAGLDVHEDSIVAAILEGDELRAEIVKLSSDLKKVRRLFGRLSPALPAMTLANEIVAIATKAQHRVSKKLWRLWERRHPRVAAVPVARELCGFVWANMNAAPQHSPRRSKESGPRGEVR